MMTINPESLQYSAVRTLINHPLHMARARRIQQQKQQYLGGITVPEDILRAVGSNRRLIRNDDTEIMELFTHTFVHSTKLIFPSSWHIPTPRQLNIHLKRWGEKLMELSVISVRCGYSTDELWEIIGNNCSSRLLRLRLPAYNSSSLSEKRGVKAITGSKFSTSLTEMTLCSAIFYDKSVLFQMLFSLPNLRKLTLSSVAVLDCGYKSALPFHPQHSLPRLEHLILSGISGCGCIFNCSYMFPNMAKEWGLFPKFCPQLKTLQIFDMSPLTEDIDWLSMLHMGILERNTPLTYLRITTKNPEMRDFIRIFKADKISASETIKEISYELTVVGDNNESAIKDCISRLPNVWRDSLKNVDECRDTLGVIYQLVPKYTHIEGVFEFCTEAMRCMVMSSKIRQELNLIPSVIDTFITVITSGDGGDDFFPHRDSYFNLCEILLVYKASIAVEVFEKILRTFIVLPFSSCLGHIFLDFLYQMTKYCTLEYILAIKRVLGNEDIKENLAVLILNNTRYIEIFVSDLEAREKTLLGI